MTPPISNHEEQTVLVDQSISVAGRPLPPPKTTESGEINGKDGNDKTKFQEGASIVLFYQYKEPVWTEPEFQKALKLFLSIGRKFSMTGRGRIAPEGVNCTLTGPSAEQVRGFCQALRDEWGVVDDDKDKNLFQQTDFKITDGLPQSQRFKSLSIRKTDELVAYGLEGEKAPSIEKFGGEHLTAVDYHKALQDKDTVVIDVRNAYETAIGTIVPPKGGATLLDPKLRNSREWPKWLASEDTQKKLSGKKILTFCTGGIRCERATALINQMATVSKSEQTATQTDPSAASDIKTEAKAKDTSGTTFEPNGVYHMRGGIERYLKTFPQGGFWSGKNYLFDKRMEQLPELKDSSQVEQEVTTKLRAKCCLCRKPWTTYRGQHKCGGLECGVPVLVCDVCHMSLTAAGSNNTGKKSKNGSAVASSPRLRCELCREGYRAPQGNPDLVAMRKRAEKLAQNQSTDTSAANAQSESKPVITYPPRKVVTDRLFLNRLPRSTTKSQIEEWLQTPIRQLHWVTDPNTGAYYGSCIVRVDVFSKVLLAIRKQDKAKGNAQEHLLLSKKTDHNQANSAVRELLGCFPGTSATAKEAPDKFRQSRKRKRPKQLQQPKIFRVLAKPDEVWPPSNHCDSEYPPLGNHLQ
eukprot:CAMPEP_0172404310 /NCGR_PEP_ID=MMETSP1061-20121228/62614_1 /TAXON_ID=37318 /ORGANISM="Pseudo-nitzschia pungens, Strain cf. pungens" /LENGTH=634 /DNA_ID=CAMNT_0013139041 /DNA_START=41 /DNA_END=1945 /DNA_ORIENTATION=+